jgi:hypothetical protein
MARPDDAGAPAAGTTHEHSASAHLPAELVFDFVTVVDHLPRYFPAITDVRRLSDRELEVTASVQGHQHTACAWYEVDHRTRTLRWGGGRARLPWRAVGAGGRQGQL